MSVSWNDLAASTDYVVVREQEVLDGNEIVKGKVWCSGNDGYSKNDIVYYCIGGFSFGSYEGENIYCISVDKIVAKEE